MLKADPRARRKRPPPQSARDPLPVAKPRAVALAEVNCHTRQVLLIPAETLRCTPLSLGSTCIISLLFPFPGYGRPSASNAGRGNAAVRSTATPGRARWARPGGAAGVPFAFGEELTRSLAASGKLTRRLITSCGPQTCLPCLVAPSLSKHGRRKQVDGHSPSNFDLLPRKFLESTRMRKYATDQRKMP